MSLKTIKKNLRKKSDNIDLVMFPKVLFLLPPLLVVVLQSVVMMMINQFLPRQNHLLSLSQMSGCSVFRFRSLNAVIGAYTASSTFWMAMLIMTMIDDGGRDVYDVCDLLSTKDVGSLKHSAFNVVFSLTLFICKCLHWVILIYKCSSVNGNGGIDDIPHGEIICTGSG